MRAKPLKLINNDYVQCEPFEATHIDLKFPCPSEHRRIPVKQGFGSFWNWNGNADRPTLHPSVLTRCELPSGDFVCHSFVVDGQVQFLGDCTHKNKGLTLDLLEF